MAVLFSNEFHDAFGTWPLAYIPYGGADFGELQAVARAVGDGDDGAFHAAFVAAGDRIAEEAEATLAAGHRVSARDLFLRASVFYCASLHPLYGAPVAPVRIPFEGAAMTAYLLPAASREHEVRPLLILTNGYDGTITDMYFASGVAASRRGYHVLMFDGPGQGEMLYVQGVPLRPDWETVIRAVVDYAVGLPVVDAQRIALSGWSLGGYLAPRGASGEPRIAALIADPGQWGIAAGMRGLVMRILGDVSDITPALVEKLRGVIEKDRRMRWAILQRGFWVHGVDNLQGFLHAVEPFTMDGRAELIRCPTLLTAAENDPLSSTAQHFYEALRCPKSLIRFTAAEGAGDHCEMMNRSLLNSRVLDWLDETLA